MLLAVFARIPPVTDFQLGQPAVTVCGKRALRRAGVRLGGHECGVGSQGFAAQRFKVAGVGHGGIFPLVERERHVPVQGQERLQGRAVRRVVLQHLCLYAHALHLDFVHVDEGGVARLESVLEKGEQLVGILHAPRQQVLQPVQADEFQTQVLGLEQDVAPQGFGTQVHGLLPLASGTTALPVHRGEIESL